MISLGIDTSNYTTSVAIFDTENGKIINKKMLLPVKEGEKGLRQSDAVFHHTIQLPKVFREITSEFGGKIDCIGVSFAPRTEDGSYMPCFLTGLGVAEIISSINNIPLYKFSHQQGHIAAVLQGADRTELFNKKFIAFHVSGGTTEALLVTPDEKIIINTELIFSSSDLKAGQAVDRVGLMLGLKFPCGNELDLLAQKSDKEYKIKTSFKDNTFSLSGVENKCMAMFNGNESKENVAKYCIDYISATLEKTIEILSDRYGKLPLVFSGGVMSNRIIRERFSEKFDAVFAQPQFSSDNAVGVSVLSAMKEKVKYE